MGSGGGRGGGAGGGLALTLSPGEEAPNVFTRVGDQVLSNMRRVPGFEDSEARRAVSFQQSSIHRFFANSFLQSAQTELNARGRPNQRVRFSTRDFNRAVSPDGRGTILGGADNRSSVTNVTIGRTRATIVTTSGRQQTVTTTVGFFRNGRRVGPTGRFQGLNRLPRDETLSSTWPNILRGGS